MPPKKENRHIVILDPETVQRLEDWRRRQPGLPAKSAAIRLMIERVLDEDEAPPKPKSARGKKP